MKFDLSDKAKEIIRKKAITFKISDSEVLDWMILEFSPSTEEEIKIQKERRMNAMEDFLNVYPDATRKEIWRNGFAIGWEYFQIRKSSHPFKNYKP
jgi:hypothetical protein